MKRPCLDCPRIGEWKRGRCDQHERARDKARGPRAHGNADATHKRTRAAYQRRIDAGETLHCWRCHEAIDPTDWHLGHDDDDRSIYRGPECPSCNLSAAGRASGMIREQHKSGPGGASTP